MPQTLQPPAPPSTMSPSASAVSTSSSTTPAYCTWATCPELTLEDFDRTIAVNVRGVFAATQAAVAHMKEGGRVINIGSTNAERMPFPGGSVYAMSKSALTGLVQGPGARPGTARHHHQ
ncbi:SDR family NAD(P)-dependent oxidoreductase [Massilia eburnea]|uniref:SDR family NAD(P)-dependent oxidoreductase n=1 Tax=Massilia eburnea TaxID=1776165 RepID=UPI003D6B7519